MLDSSAPAGVVEVALPQGFQDAVRRLATTVLADEPRVRLLPFGSRATGRSDPRSDIDVGVDLGHPVDTVTLNRLREAFDELPILQKVDVVDLASVDDDFIAVEEPEDLLRRGRDPDVLPERQSPKRLSAGDRVGQPDLAQDARGPEPHEPHLHGGHRGRPLHAVAEVPIDDE
jgi:predicted nucleotidyltransferase